MSEPGEDKWPSVDARLSALEKRLDALEAAKSLADVSALDRSGSSLPLPKPKRQENEQSSEERKWEEDDLGNVRY